MKKNNAIKRILCLVFTLIVGMSLTFMDVYAIEDIQATEGGEPEAVQEETTTPEEPEMTTQEETQPISVVTKAGNGTITVSWTAIAGAEEYSLSCNGETPETLNATSKTFDGLNNGEKYEFTVKCSVTEIVTPDEGEPYEVTTLYEGSKSDVPSVAPAITASLKDYNGVTLKWNAVENATGYNVYRNGAKVASVGEVQQAYVGGVGAGTGHTYTIKPVFEGLESSVVSAGAAGYAVDQMYLTFKVKRNKTLTSHSGGKVKIKVKKNQSIRAVGFSAGKYHFYSGGRLYYINRTSTKNAGCVYTKALYYTDEEATNYVNHRGLSSGTGWLIWASYNTQHVYIFRGSAGHWNYVNGWEVSTGKAKTPSPMGVKKIGKKIKKRHGLRWWSCYSSLNAFHGVNASSWKRKLGTPQSGGCIRNLTPNAQWIYNNVPKNTTVLCY